MSQSFLGTQESGDRRLGSDFALLGKYTSAFACRTAPTVPLACLSQHDQNALFAKPACNFRIQRGPNNEVKLETVDDGPQENALATFADSSPDVAAMMGSLGYLYQLSTRVEQDKEVREAQPEKAWMKALLMEEAKGRGDDLASAAQYAEFEGNKHLDHVRYRTRLLQIQRNVDAATEELQNGLGAKRYLQQSLVSAFFPEAIRPESTQPKPEPKHKTAATFEHVESAYTTPDHKSKLTDPSPDYGSETTASSMSSTSSSSKYFSPGSTTMSSEYAGEFNANGQFIQAQGGQFIKAQGGQFIKAQAGRCVQTHNGQYTQAQNVQFLQTHNGQYVQAHSGQSIQAQNVQIVQDHNGQFIQAPNGHTIQAQNAQFVQAYNGRPVHEQFIQSPNGQFVQAQHGRYPVAKVQQYKDFIFYDMPFCGGKDIIEPEYWTTRIEKQGIAKLKCRSLELEDAKIRASPQYGSVSQNPIHVFVDLSNIIIGFYDTLKAKRRINVQRRVTAPPFCFENFDTLLTRNRTVAKRALAGSLGSHTRRYPAYLVKAEELGYELNIMQRVPKIGTPPSGGNKGSKGKNQGSDEYTSGQDTSGDDIVGPVRRGEQGVDEVLHLKILQSTIDNVRCEGTIVVASGDAATAEFSDGFKKNVERALQFGWNVEICGWSRNMSSAWREPQFLQRWGDRVRIIELDDFCEELLDISIDVYA
ncbi:hypothetical protein B0H63DRAFT_171737 [Podospora didyma]|uniref:NYN domain-containing protein n=1 Tax=Podospora didyma TaxID=330526 RepID=A0AAE0NNK0_9PEZI|nr:hypothetical protein B0H63DRAFT_171737 [Podospora didyma]